MRQKDDAAHPCLREDALGAGSEGSVPSGDGVALFTDLVEAQVPFLPGTRPLQAFHTAAVRRLRGLRVPIGQDLRLTAISDARLPGRPPKLSHSELLCLAVMQAMLGFHCEARWLRYVRVHLQDMFPFIPQDAGYDKRLRAALPQIKRVIRTLARDTDFWHDTVWITDSTPVPCGMSRPTVRRSELAGWANYGYCSSHSRFFWGLRLYLVCTPAGMPILWALADPKLGEREVLAAMLEVDAGLVHVRPGLLLISDKGFASKTFERSLSAQGITLLRPSRKKEILRPGEPMLKKVRQLIESVNDTLKGQLDLEQHGGRTVEGVAVRVAQRVLALAAAIWHNFQTGQAVSRSLTAYDH